MAEPPLAATAASIGERGSVTVWLLGVCVMILFVAGFSVDLWRAMGERRAIAGAVDAAAVAGAAAIDQAAFREDGVVALATDDAEAAAQDALITQLATTGADVTATGVTATAEEVAVTVTGRIDVTLLALLHPTRQPWTVQVTATAEPWLGEP